MFAKLFGVKASLSSYNTDNKYLVFRYVIQIKVNIGYTIRLTQDISITWLEFQELVVSSLS